MLHKTNGLNGCTAITSQHSLPSFRADRLVREYKTVKTTCSCGANVKVKTSQLSDQNFNSNSSGSKDFSPKLSPAFMGNLNTPPSHRRRVPTPPKHRHTRLHPGVGLGKENSLGKPPHPPTPPPTKSISPPFQNRHVGHPSTDIVGRKTYDVVKRYSSGHVRGRKVLGVLNGGMSSECRQEGRDKDRRVTPERTGVVE